MKKTALSAALLLATSASQADILTFDIGGLFTMVNPAGDLLVNGDSSEADGYQTVISGTMTFDTLTGQGSSVINSFDFFGGGPALPHDITMQAIGAGDGVNPGYLVAGNMLFDWNGNNDIAVEIVMDAGGFFTSGLVDAAGAYTGAFAIGDALTLGPAAVGNASVGICTYDHPTYGCLGTTNDSPAFITTIDGNPNSTENVTILNGAGDVVFSGNRHTDGLSGIAMDNGPFPGFNANFDIHSMTLTSVTSAVPVPAAVWLFGSGLVGLAGIARRRKTA